MNAQQLAALRALGSQHENEEADRRSQLQGDYDAKLAQLQAELDSLQENRASLTVPPNSSMFIIFRTA